MKNVIVDVLRMFLRISDRLEMILQKNLEAMDCTWSTDLTLNNLNLKKYIEHLESIGIKKPYRIENRDVVLRDLNGVEKTKVFKTIDLASLFSTMNRKEEKSLWSNFFQFYLK